MKWLLILGGLLAVVSCHGVERSFQITLRVIDDEGKPVVGAKGGVSWENAKATKPSEQVSSNEGVSNEDGQVVLKGKTHVAGISYGVNKQGHYAAWGMRYHFKGARLLRWQPWNPTIEVVLKRKKNPVPMYAKRISDRLPALDVAVGYDFESGDWVAPHGRGKRADMLFSGHLQQEGPNDFDWVLKISFPATGDGIQRFSANPTLNKEDYQRLVLYDAPEDGYASEWTLKRSRKPGLGEQTSFDSNSGYYFRVRTELDRDGKVVKARYGKIYGDFFDMVYYLNPDGTRNIEYDPKRNLLNPTGADRPEFSGLMP